MAAEFSSLLFSSPFFYFLFLQSVSFDTYRMNYYSGRDHPPIFLSLALPFFQFTWATLVSIHGLVGFSFRLGLHFSGGTTRYFFRDPLFLFIRFGKRFVNTLQLLCCIFLSKHLSVLSLYLSFCRILLSFVKYIDSIFAYIISIN